MNTYIPLPSVQEMEELSRTIGVPEGCVAVRVSKDGKVTYLTKQEYEELWQNSQTSGESSEK